jgi:hypothetical protein
LLRTSVGNRLMVDKPLGQLELPIRVKHVTVLSPGESQEGRVLCPFDFTEHTRCV